MEILVAKYNCGQGYKSTIASLETAINIRAGIICLQKSFIGNRNITYSVFNLYLLERSKTKVRIVTIIKKKLINEIIIENRLVLIDYLYFLLLNI